MLTRKCFSVFVSFVFLFSVIFPDFAAAVPDPSDVVGSISLTDKPADNSFGRYAQVTSVSDYGGDTLVLNVQDFHMHPEVQMNISSIIEILVKEYGVKNVFVEGAYGRISTDWLSSMKKGYLGEEALDSLLSAGTITGAEYYAAVNDKNDFLIGLEDENIHKANIGRLGTLIEKRDYYDGAIASLGKELDFFQKKYFGKENKKLAKLVKQHKNGKISSEKYYTLLFNYLNNNSEQSSGTYGTIMPMDMSDYPNICLLLHSYKIQRSMNVNNINKDLQKLVVTLKESMSFYEYKKMLDRTNNMQDMYLLVSYLGTMPQDFKDRHFTPGIAKYIDVTNRSKQINPVELIAEERFLLHEIRIALSSGKNELEVSFLSDFFAYFSDYLKTSISADDYVYLKNGFDKFQRLWGKYSFYNKTMNDLKSEFALLNEYYEVNDNRNEIFLKQIEKNALVRSGRKNNPAANGSLDAVLKEKKNIIVCVTGGYHSKGLTDLLADKKVSFAVVTPSVYGNAGSTLKNYENAAYEQAKIFSQGLALSLYSQVVSYAISSDNLEAKRMAAKLFVSAAKDLENIPFENINALIENLNAAVGSGYAFIYNEAEGDIILSSSDGKYSEPFIEVRKNSEGKISIKTKYSSEADDKVLLKGFGKLFTPAQMKEFMENFANVLKISTLDLGTDAFLPKMYSSSVSVINWAAKNNLFLDIEAVNGISFEMAERYGFDDKILFDNPDVAKYHQQWQNAILRKYLKQADFDNGNMPEHIKLMFATGLLDEFLPISHDTLMMYDKYENSLASTIIDEVAKLRAGERLDYGKMPAKPGTAGVRGAIGEVLTITAAQIIAQAQANLALRDLKPGDKPFIVIGGDTRYGGTEFKKAIAGVFLANGFEVQMFEENVPTPLISFYTKELESLAVNVTGSHNKGTDTGYKFTINGAQAPDEYGVDLVSEMEKIVRLENEGKTGVKYNDPEEAIENGTIKLPDTAALSKKYSKALLTKAAAFFGMTEKELTDLIERESSDSPFSIFEANNGTAPVLLGDVYTEFHIDQNNVMVLHDSRDTAFRGKSPEPNESNLADLKQQMLDMKKANPVKNIIGLATDVDSDRVGTILYFDGNEIKAMTPNEIALIKQYMLINSRSDFKAEDVFVRTQATTHSLDVAAALRHLKVISTNVGSKYIAQEIENPNQNVLLGAESSGTILYKDWILDKDGIMANMLMYFIPIVTKKSYSEILKEIYDSIGYEIAFTESKAEIDSTERKNATLDFFKNASDEEILSLLDLSKIGKNARLVRTESKDGIYIGFANDKTDQVQQDVTAKGGTGIGTEIIWLQMRGSGTENAMRVYAESNDPKITKYLIEAGKKIAQGAYDKFPQHKIQSPAAEMKATPSAAAYEVFNNFFKNNPAYKFAEAMIAQYKNIEKDSSIINRLAKQLEILREGTKINSEGMTAQEVMDLFSGEGALIDGEKALNEMKYGTAGYRERFGERLNYVQVLVNAQAIAEVAKERFAAAKAAGGLAGRSRPKVFIGYDTRFMSKEFAETISAVLAENGVEAELSDIDTPTPAISWLLGDSKGEEYDLAVNITASHNPFEYNGIKVNEPFGGQAGGDITGAIESKMRDIAEGKTKIRYANLSKGFEAGNVIMNNNLKERYIAAYIEMVKRQFNINNEADFEAFKNKAENFYFVVDVKSGTTPEYYKEIMDALGISNYEMINYEYDPTFKGEDPNPDKNTVQMKERMEEIKKANPNAFVYGLATDPDGDRMAVLENDKTFKTDEVIIYNQYRLLEKAVETARQTGKKQEVVIAPNLATTGAMELIAEYFEKTYPGLLDIKIVRTNIGFKWIAEVMKEAKDRNPDVMVMGAEESGAVVVGGLTLDKDGLVATLGTALQAIDTGETIASTLEHIYSDKVLGWTPQKDMGSLKFDSMDDLAAKGAYLESVVDDRAVRKEFIKRFEHLNESFKIGRIEKIVGTSFEGIQIFTDNPRVLIILRLSGTEPLVKVYAESDIKELTDAIIDAGKNALNNIPAVSAEAEKTDVSVKKADIRDINITPRQKFIIRVDYNVPMKDGKITDDTRIRATLETIKYITGRGGRVVLMSHLGRPDGKVVASMSLAPVAAYLGTLLGKNVKFLNDAIGENNASEISAMKNGGVALLENVRFYAEEEANNNAFAQKLAENVGNDAIFVMDAFGTAHRAHSSTVGISKFVSQSVAGLLMSKELQFLGRELENPQSPSVAIIGGSKVSDKIGVISSLLEKTDTVIIGGAMAYSFLAAQGVEIGDSLADSDNIALAKELLEKAAAAGKTIVLPVDHKVVKAGTVDFKNAVLTEGNDLKNTPDVAIEKGYMGSDIGDKTVEMYASIITKAKTVLWNGPMGIFEVDALSSGTTSIAQAMVKATEENGAVTIVGGGDSVAAVNKAGVADKMSHVSTGGGASLEFLEKGTLPGVESLGENLPAGVNKIYYYANTLTVSYTDLEQLEKDFERLRGSEKKYLQPLRLSSRPSEDIEEYAIGFRFTAMPSNETVQAITDMLKGKATVLETEKRIEKQAGREVGKKLTGTVLDTDKAKSDAFLKGGYEQSGYGVPGGAVINGSFGLTGTQGYYAEAAGNRNFIESVDGMRKFFENHPDAIRVFAKTGIGGQHTPFQGIADGFKVSSDDKVRSTKVLGEYELGKDYEAAMQELLDSMNIGWDRLGVDPSSKSGSTDETMMIYSELLYLQLKHISAAQTGIDGERFAETVFDTLHEINFTNGEENPGKDLFKIDSERFGTDNLIDLLAQRANAGGLNVTREQVRQIFATVIGNTFFETTNRPDQSRLAAFLTNSGLKYELGEAAENIVEMFDNVGGRWTADLHMMAFLAYYGLDAQAYWNVRNQGIREVVNGTHRSVELAGRIIDEDITDIALVVPDELFWFGKSIEQNFNESIWQPGFANIVVIKQSHWKNQQQNYRDQTGRMVINLSSRKISSKNFNVQSMPAGNIKDLNPQEIAEMYANLTTLFYGITSTVGDRLIARELLNKGFMPENVDLNDLDNDATKIVQENLYLRQPYVELGKGLLETRLKDLQKQESETPGEIDRAMDTARAQAMAGELKTAVPGLQVPVNITDMQAFADVIKQAADYAKANNRKFVPFIYLEGEKFSELRNYLTELGIEWVLQGTGDQHISYQQVLAQPQKYLPFIISFVPENVQPGRRAIGFAKGYLDKVSPNLVRDYFAEASYQALTDRRKDQGGQGFFLRLTDSPENISMLKQAAKKAVDGESSQGGQAIMRESYPGVLSSLINGNSALGTVLRTFSREFPIAKANPSGFVQAHMEKDRMAASSFADFIKNAPTMLIQSWSYRAFMMAVFGAAGFSIMPALAFAGAFVGLVFSFAAAGYLSIFPIAKKYLSIDYKFVKDFKSDINRYSPKMKEKDMADADHLEAVIINTMPENPQELGFKNTGLKTSDGKVIWASKKTGRLVIFANEGEFSDIALSVTDILPAVLNKTGSGFEISAIAVDESAGLPKNMNYFGDLLVLKKSYYDELLKLAGYDVKVAGERIRNEKEAGKNAAARNFVMDLSSLESADSIKDVIRTLSGYNKTDNSQIAVPYSFIEKLANGQFEIESKGAQTTGAERKRHVENIMKSIVSGWAQSGLRVFAVMDENVQDKYNMRAKFIEYGFAGYLERENGRAVAFRDYTSDADSPVAEISGFKNRNELVRQIENSKHDAVKIINVWNFTELISKDDSDIASRVLELGSMFGRNIIGVFKKTVNEQYASDSVLDLNMNAIPNISAEMMDVLHNAVAEAENAISELSSNKNESAAARLRAKADAAVGKALAELKKMPVETSIELNMINMEISENVSEADIEKVRYAFLKAVAQKAKVKADLYADSPLGLEDKELERLFVKSALSQYDVDKNIIIKLEKDLTVPETREGEKISEAELSNIPLLEDRTMVIASGDTSSVMTARQAFDTVSVRAKELSLRDSVASATIYEMILLYAERKTDTSVKEKSLSIDTKSLTAMLAAA